jgi:hypothetical protein
MASIFEQAAGYLPWNSWGGTEHLEDKRAAAVKYAERITGWSDTDTWGLWIDSDRLRALDDAQKAYFYAKDAAGYWARVASLWEGYAESMISIHPDQFDKIAASVGASQDAAKTYRDARNWVEYAKEIVPTPAQFPWWVYGIGVLALWNTIRK